MKVVNVGNDEYTKLHQKYQQLKDHNAFRELILEYIN